MKTKTIPSWGILSDPVGNDEGGKYTNPEPRTWIYGRKTLLSHTSFGAAAAADRGRVNVCLGEIYRGQSHITGCGVYFSSSLVSSLDVCTVQVITLQWI